MEFIDIFALDDRTLGKCTIDEHIVTLIDPNQTPIKHLPYKYSPALRTEINRQIKEWLDLDIIEPSCNPWSFPVVVCDKKSLDQNGRPEKRVFIDLRSLNKVIKDYCFTIPDVQTSIEAIGEAEAMSLMDYKYGFLQKVIRDSDRDLVSFVTQDAQYRFKRMCYGMRTAPSSLMRTQTKIFSDLINKCVIIYFDVNLAFSNSIEEHFEHLRLIFKRIRSSGMTLKPKKCFFFKTEITFLGYRIFKAGIDADTDKIRATVDFPTSQNVSEVS